MRVLGEQTGQGNCWAAFLLLLGSGILSAYCRPSTVEMSVTFQIAFVSI